MATTLSPFRSYVDYAEAPSSVQWEADHRFGQACKRFREDPGALTDDDIQWIRLLGHRSIADPITALRAIEARDSARRAVQEKRDRSVAKIRRAAHDALGATELTDDHARLLEQFASLCEQHKITVKWASPGSMLRDRMEGRVYGASVAHAREIYLQPIIDLHACATAFHEIGHVLTEQSTDPCENEFRAWRWALKNMPIWTVGCHRHMADSLRISIGKLERHKAGITLGELQHSAAYDEITSDRSYMLHARPAPAGFNVEKRFRDRTVEKQAVDKAITEALEQPDTTRELVERIEKLESKSVAFRGVYQKDQKYERGDLVVHAGGMWLCRDPQTMAVPGGPTAASRSWQLATKAGSLSK